MAWQAISAAISHNTIGGALSSGCRMDRRLGMEFMRLPGLNASRYRGEIWLHSRNFAATIEFEPQGSTGLLERPITRSKIQPVAGDAGADHVDPGLVAQAYGFRKTED